MSLLCLCRGEKSAVVERPLTLAHALWVRQCVCSLHSWWEHHPYMLFNT
ncbi:MAG: hypothetical protein SOY99_07585 [Alloprevotella sp.]|nr:hypothetical protein [Bacteroidales bacterium]MDY3944060.1 hypothetical protein [Alloprevotella sp.]MDY3944071.1 hypothetical protein [Alloprevotella sp.]